MTPHPTFERHGVRDDVNNNKFEDNWAIIVLRAVEKHRVQTKYFIQFCTNAVDC